MKYAEYDLIKAKKLQKEISWPFSILAFGHSDSSYDEQFLCQEKAKKGETHNKIPVKMIKMRDIPL